MTKSHAQGRSWDAVVVGAGHNGLTAASYLAKSGLSTLVLERRPIVGGACVTEEIAPGCRASTTSYIASMLRPEVIRDLDLAAEGLRMVPCDPLLLVPFADGTATAWWSDRARTVGSFARLPEPTRAILCAWTTVEALARHLQPFFLEPSGRRRWQCGS
jgi:phytoene dehydrogenase-like protein